jgi:hypothetical protein
MSKTPMKGQETLTRYGSPETMDKRWSTDEIKRCIRISLEIHWQTLIASERIKAMKSPHGDGNTRRDLDEERLS